MPTTVIADDVHVLPQLSRMKLPKPTLRAVLQKVAGERANVRTTDPHSAAGYETWRWALRFLREDEDLTALGWVQCDHGQVEGIRHDELRIRVVPCSMDKNTGDPDPDKMPRNVRPRGPAAKRLINNNRGQMVMAFMDQPSSDPIADYDFWYFGLRIADDFLTAEVSRPDSATDAGFIDHYSHRIIVAKQGDLDGLRARDSVPEEFAEISKPPLRRKTTS